MRFSTRRWICASVLAGALALFTACAALASRQSFYVSPSGSDSNVGSRAHPWRTIQHAALMLHPGQTAIVINGDYHERVSLLSSGAPQRPITLKAAGGGARLLGFSLSGSYWVVSGFDISTQTNGSDGFGVFIGGSAHHDTIENNYIHELCHEGTFMTPGVSHLIVRGNRIWRAEMTGIQVNGTYQLVEQNQVWGTQEIPNRGGGIYQRCIKPPKSDADGIRFFGQHIVIRSNYLHDIVFHTKTNPDPHIDCFQTWGSSAMAVDDIVIERNFCRWPVAAPDVDNESAMVEGLDGRVGTLVFRNNIFVNMRQGINVASNVAALTVFNNTFDHILQQAIIFRDKRSDADRIINNIFYNVGGGADSYLCLPSGNPVIATNDFWMPSGRVGGYCSSAPYLNLPPMFVNYGDSTGAGADFHLLATSPLRDRGTTLPDVTNDYDGADRPIGHGYSIGAFEK